jgi:hypothetical protein
VAGGLHRKPLRLPKYRAFNAFFKAFEAGPHETRLIRTE